MADLLGSLAGLITSRWDSSKLPRKRRARIALVCSHGGHLTELLALSAAWRERDHFWITYDSPRTASLENAYRLRNIGFNPWLMAISFFRIAHIFARERPNLLISNGAEVAIPAVLLARAIGCRVVFIEVWTRVRKPTLTGRVVYPMADEFFVMWPELADSYGPRARFAGGLA